MFRKSLSLRLFFGDLRYVIEQLCEEISFIGWTSRFGPDSAKLAWTKQLCEEISLIGWTSRFGQIFAKLAWTI